MKTYRRSVSLLVAVLLLLTAFAGCGKKKERFIKEPRVSYLGPQGTYTEEAAQFFFSAISNISFCLFLMPLHPLTKLV